LNWRPRTDLFTKGYTYIDDNLSFHRNATAPGEFAVDQKIDLTWSIMWINIAIKSHITEVRYENRSDDT